MAKANHKFRAKDFGGETHVGYYFYDKYRDSHFILSQDMIGNIREAKVDPKTVVHFHDTTEMGDRCDSCGQKIKQAYKEQISKHKLTMLQTVARHVIDTGVNDFNLRRLNDSTTNYINFQKLRYHGLVHHVRDSKGNQKRGHWLITRNGWSFLRGEIDIPKYVTVKENQIVDRSRATINVKDVYRGSEAIITTFEYFDDYGNKVGVKPQPRNDKSNQSTLL